MAREVQAAMDRATQVDTFGDRQGEVQAAMRDVGCGGPNWTWHLIQRLIMGEI